VPHLANLSIFVTALVQLPWATTLRYYGKNNYLDVSPWSDFVDWVRGHAFVVINRKRFLISFGTKVLSLKNSQPALVSWCVIGLCFLRTLRYRSSKADF
jgi:hypothetical protein